VTQPDTSFVETLEDASENVLLTTEVSAPDAQNRRTHKVIQPDTSFVEEFKDAAENVLQTTEVSAPDGQNRRTRKVSQPDTSFVETLEDAAENVLQTTEVSAPDGQNRRTQRVTLPDTSFVEELKDNNGNVLLTTDVSAPDNNNRRKHKVIQPDQSRVEEIKETNGDVFETTVVTKPDESGEITETTTQLDGTLIIVVKDSALETLRTTTISVRDAEGNYTETLVNRDGSGQTLYKDINDQVVQTVNTQAGGTNVTFFVDDQGASHTITVEPGAKEVYSIGNDQPANPDGRSTTVDVDIAPEFGDDFDQLLVTNTTVLIKKKDGSWNVWGRGWYGMLGDGQNHSTSYYQTTAIPNAALNAVKDQIVDVKISDAHVIVLMSDGYLYGMGLNDHYQLGNGNNTHQMTLVPCTWFNAIVDSGWTIKHFDINTTGTMVCFTNGSVDKVYSAGRNLNYGLMIGGTNHATYSSLQSANLINGPYLDDGSHRVEDMRGHTYTTQVLMRNIATNTTKWYVLGYVRKRVDAYGIYLSSAEVQSTLVESNKFTSFLSTYPNAVLAEGYRWASSLFYLPDGTLYGVGDGVNEPWGDDTAQGSYRFTLNSLTKLNKLSNDNAYWQEKPTFSKAILSGSVLLVVLENVETRVEVIVYPTNADGNDVTETIQTNGDTQFVTKDANGTTLTTFDVFAPNADGIVVELTTTFPSGDTVREDKDGDTVHIRTTTTTNASDGVVTQTELHNVNQVTTVTVTQPDQSSVITATTYDGIDTLVTTKNTSQTTTHTIRTILPTAETPTTTVTEIDYIENVTLHTVTQSDGSYVKTETQASNGTTIITSVDANGDIINIDTTSDFFTTLANSIEVTTTVIKTEGNVVIVTLRDDEGVVLQTIQEDTDESGVETRVEYDAVANVTLETVTHPDNSTVVTETTLGGALVVETAKDPSGTTTLTTTTSTIQNGTVTETVVNAVENTTVETITYTNNTSKVTATGSDGVVVVTDYNLTNTTVTSTVSGVTTQTVTYTDESAGVMETITQSDNSSVQTTTQENLVTVVERNTTGAMVERTTTETAPDTGEVTVTVTDFVAGSTTATVTQPDQSSVVTETLSNGTVVVTTKDTSGATTLKTTTTALIDGVATETIEYPDDSSVAYARDGDGTLLSTTTTSIPDSITGEYTETVTNADGSTVVSTITRSDGLGSSDNVQSVLYDTAQGGAVNTSFTNVSLSGTNVAYTEDLVFGETKTVAVYRNQTVHRATFDAPTNADYIVDIVFKQNFATTSRQSFFGLSVGGSTKLYVYVAHEDYWRINGSMGMIKVQHAGNTGMNPVRDQYARYTFVFRNATNLVEFYYNGEPFHLQYENGDTVVQNNTFTLPNTNLFGTEMTMDLGHSQQGTSADPSTIASVHVISSDGIETGFGNAAFVQSLAWENLVSYTATYIVATSAPDANGNVSERVTIADGSSTITVTNAEGNVVSTTQVSVPDESSGEYTETTTNTDGSTTITTKDANDTVISSTTTSIPDANGEYTETVTNAVGVVTTTVFHPDGSRTESTTVAMESDLFVNAYTNSTNGYTVPNTVVTIDGVDCWDCQGVGITNETTPVTLTGNTMTVGFWGRVFYLDNHILFKSNDADGFRTRFMYKNRGTNRLTRSFHNGSWREVTVDPAATLNSWEFIMMVYDGNQVTSYIIPHDFDISQGIVENTHYRTETFAGSPFGDNPITELVSTGHNNKVYLASAFAWNKVLTLDEVIATYTLTKPNSSSQVPGTPKLISAPDESNGEYTETVTNADGSTTITTKDANDVVLFVTQVSVPDESNGEYTETVTNNDGSTTVTTKDANDDMLYTKIVSVPDANGEYTETVTNADGSSVIQTKDANDVVLSTTTKSVPDPITGYYTETVTSAGPYKTGYKYMKLHVLNNHGNATYQTFTEFSVPGATISSISTTAPVFHASYTISAIHDGNPDTYHTTTQTTPFDVVVVFSADLSDTFVASFVNIWNNQGWSNVDVYLSVDNNAAWELVHEVRGLAYAPKEDVSGRTTDVSMELPRETQTVTTTKDAQGYVVFPQTLVDPTYTVQWTNPVSISGDTLLEDRQTAAYYDNVTYKYVEILVGESIYFDVQTTHVLFASTYDADTDTLTRTDTQVDTNQTFAEVGVYGFNCFASHASMLLVVKVVTPPTTPPNTTMVHTDHSLETYTRNSFTPGFTVNLENNNTRMAIRGVSGWSYVKLGTKIDMVVDNTYTFDIYMTDANLSKRYFALVFGNQFSMDRSLHGSPPNHFMGVVFMVKLYSNGHWDTWHNGSTISDVWKDSTGVALIGNNGGASAFSFTFPQYWKVTVVKRDGLNDLKLEGFADSQRILVTAWAFVSELGAYSNHVSQSEFLQHEIVDFGVSHGSSVGTTEYIVFENLKSSLLTISPTTGSSTPMVSADALVMYDAFQTDAVQGAVLKDFSGNGRDATITGGLNVVDHGFNFTGSNFAHVNNLGNPSGNWRHSISMWIYVDEWPLTTKACPWFIGAASSNKASSLDMNTTNDINWYFYGNDVKFHDPPLTANTWTHLCFVYDTSNTKLFYINGELSYQASSPSASAINANSPLWVGKDGARNTNPLVGKIRQFAVYNRVLSQEEVTQNYNAGLAVPVSPTTSTRTQLQFRVKEVSYNTAQPGRIDLMEIQMFDAQDNLVPYTATLGGSPNAGRDDPTFLYDGLKTEGGFKGITWDTYALNDTLVTVNGDFASVAKIRLYHFRHYSGGSYEILDQDGTLLATTTRVNSDATGGETIAEMTASGTYQEVAIEPVNTTATQTQINVSYKKSLGDSTNAANAYMLPHLVKTYLVIVTEGGDTTVVPMHTFNTLDNGWVQQTFEYTSTTELTALNGIYVTFTIEQNNNSFADFGLVDIVVTIDGTSVSHEVIPGNFKWTRTEGVDTPTESAMLINMSDGDIPFTTLTEGALVVHNISTTAGMQALDDGRNYVYFEGSLDLLGAVYGSTTNVLPVNNTATTTSMVSTDALVLYDALQTDAVNGTVLKDFSGNGRDATITGGLNVADDGFVFTGDNQVYLSGIGNPSGDWPHTISIWMNTHDWPIPQTSTQQRQDPFYIGRNDTGKGSAIDLKNSDIYWYFYAVDGGHFSNPGITSNTWFHLCLVYDSSNTKYFYINGELKFQVISSANNLDSNTPLWLGLDGPRNTSKWNGKIRQFGVYDRVFTAQEVMQNYTAGILDQVTAPVSSFAGPFTAVTSMPLADSTYPIGNADRTITAWMQLSASGYTSDYNNGRYTIVHLGVVGQTAKAFGLQVRNDRLGLLGWGNDYWDSTSAHTLNDFNEHFVAVAWNGSTNTATGYVDGQVAWTTTMNAFDTPSAPVDIGRSIDRWDFNFGIVRDVSIYDVVLTTEEVMQNYNAGLAAQVTAPEGSTLTVLDVPVAQRSFSDSHHESGLQNSKLDYTKGWAAANPVTGSWIQMDLGQNTVISGVITKGRNDAPQWVTQIKVETSVDDTTWDLVLADVPANTDSTTQVTNEFPELVNARYVRITVMGFYGHPAMRAAVLGYTAS